MTSAELNAEWTKLDTAVTDVDTDMYPEEIDTLSEWIKKLRRSERATVLREVAAGWQEKYPQNAHANEWARELTLRAEQIEKGTDE